MCVSQDMAPQAVAANSLTLCHDIHLCPAFHFHLPRLMVPLRPVVQLGPRNFDAQISWHFAKNLDLDSGFTKN